MHQRTIETIESVGVRGKCRSLFLFLTTCFFLNLFFLPSGSHGQSFVPDDSTFAPGATPKEDDAYTKQLRLLRRRFAAINLDPSGHLPIFGENIFQSPSTRLAPTAGLDLPKNYLLGPGDVLGIYLLGKSQQEMQLTVAADGKLYLPAAGVVAVSGRTLDESRALIDKSLARVYGGYDLELMLITPKLVSVDLTGEVRRPGRYSLSSLNTVLDALSAAGGIAPLGSLRHVQLSRAGATKQIVDLYPFLLQSDRRDEFFLQSGDRIFVPPSRDWVAMTGDVLRPGMYELGLTPTPLPEALAMAGGAAPLADLRRLELSRVDSLGRRYAQALDLQSAAQSVLRHGDRVRVYSKTLEQQSSTASIYGEIRQPGIFPFEKGWRVDDLIQKAGGLTRLAYLDEADIARVEPGQPPKTIKFSLARALAGDTLANLTVLEDDQIFIRRIPDWNVGPLVEIRGEVRFPGMYPIARDRTTLKDLINQAGGFTSRALLRDARLLRPSLRPHLSHHVAALDSMPHDKFSRADYEDFVMRHDVAGLSHVSVSFYKLFVQGDESYDVILTSGDLIDVPRADSLVFVSGRVGLPGGVPFVAGKDAGYYIKKAGGATHDGVRRKAKVIRASGEILDDDDVARLEPGDAIWVPRRGDHSRWSTVRDIITVLAQLATIYVVVDRATE